MILRDGITKFLIFNIVVALVFHNFDILPFPQNGHNMEWWIADVQQPHQSF